MGLGLSKDEAKYVAGVCFFNQKVKVVEKSETSKVSNLAVVKATSDPDLAKTVAKTSVIGQAAENSGTENGSRFIYHVVAPGDTLWKIANKYNGLTVEELKKANQISDNKSLKLGTKLKIPLKS